MRYVSAMGDRPDVAMTLAIFCQDKTNMADRQAKFDLALVDEVSLLQKDWVVAYLPEDFLGKADDYLLLTADDSVACVQAVLDVANLKNVVMYVQDFKDGRVFSLIRQIRQINLQANIIIAGEYGLDQSSYFVKAGASGFLVSDDKIQTLKHTLGDLKTAQSPKSLQALPMFR